MLPHLGAVVKAVVGGMPGSHGTFLSSWPASLREQPFSCCSLAHLTKPDTRRASKAKGILGGLKLSKGMTPASFRVPACKTLTWGGKMHVCIKGVLAKLYTFQVLSGLLEKKKK